MRPVQMRRLASIMYGLLALLHRTLPDPLTSKSTGSACMDTLRLWLVLAFFIGVAAYAIIVMAMNPV